MTIYELQIRHLLLKSTKTDAKYCYTSDISKCMHVLVLYKEISNIPTTK